MVCVSVMSCAGPTEGPDKQFAGTFGGAASGAGAGAITGFQVGAGTGPGALVGAGLGAVAGTIQGAVNDKNEADLMRLSAEMRAERQKAYVHEVLSDHYKRRLEIHPTRDIYPADLFFDGDSIILKPEGSALVKELARLNKKRVPWSRLIIAAYAKASDSESEFARRLCEKRSREIGDHLVAGGIEPRRIQTRVVLLDQPLVVDPSDDPSRYNQAIEIIPIDR
jgi:outer membrane protein OmpA-like peptidoglycan-associated protein